MALTTARINAAVDAALTTTTHAQLHTGDPGSAGTNNVAADVSRVACVFPAASATDSAQSFTFTIPGAGGPYTHVSFWTASTSGTYNGSGALTPQETFAGAGTLAVTATVDGSST